MPGSGGRLALLTTSVLVISGVLYVATDRGLYVDGALYFLNIVRYSHFLHVSDTRTSATFLTQLPLVVSLWLGVDSLRVLAHLHTLSLALVPLGAYGAALWTARRHPALLGATIAVVVLVFYPTSFVLNGEFHVLYALYWLSFIILVSGAADRLAFACLLLCLGFGLMRSYEVSLLLCPILAALSLWRAVQDIRRPAAAVLLICTFVFVLGAWFGLIGVVYPRSVVNMDKFSLALQATLRNRPLMRLTILVLLAGAAGFVSGTGKRWVAALVLAALALAFVVSRIDSPTILGLGREFDARAQVLPLLLAASVACLLFPLLQRLTAWSWQPGFLLVPLLAAFILDAHDTFGWQRFLGSMCEELASRDIGHADLGFAQRPTSEKFGWDWTFPTLSALLRPPDSTAVISDTTYHGWVPPNTEAEASAIAGYKQAGGLCGTR